jgi:hypothetical protein
MIKNKYPQTVDTSSWKIMSNKPNEILVYSYNDPTKLLYKQTLVHDFEKGKVILKNIFDIKL